MPKCQGITKRGTPCSLMTTTKECCHLHRPREECAICLRDIAPSTIHHIGCGGHHVFHKACINTWFLNHSTCPMCRAEVFNPIAKVSLPEPQQPIVDYRSVGIFIYQSLRHDPTKRVSLHFTSDPAGGLAVMEDAIFWNEETDEDDDIAHIFIDGVHRCVLQRWWPLHGSDSM